MTMKKLQLEAIIQCMETLILLKPWNTREYDLIQSTQCMTAGRFIWWFPKPTTIYAIIYDINYDTSTAVKT